MTPRVGTIRGLTRSAALLSAALALAALSGGARALANDCCSPGIDFPPPVGYDGVPGRGDGHAGGAKVVVVDPTGADGSARTIAQGLRQVARGGLLMIKAYPASMPYALGPNFPQAPVPGYREALVITKAVRIRSFDPNTKIVLTPPPGSSCVTVKPGNGRVVELADFVMLQSGTAPACVLVQSGVFSLTGSVVYGTPGSAAVSLTGAKARIEGNLIASAGIGVLVNYGYLSSFELKTNTITGNGTGLDVRGPVQLSALSNSIYANNGAGIIGTGGDGNYQDNMVMSNGGDGIVLRSGNSFSSVIANEISGNGGAGLRLESGALARVGANRLDGNQNGPFAGLNDGGFAIFTAPNFVNGKEYSEKKRRRFWDNSSYDAPGTPRYTGKAGGGRALR